MTINPSFITDASEPEGWRAAEAECFVRWCRLLQRATAKTLQ